MSIWIPQLRYYHIYDDQMITLKSTNYIERGLSQNSSLSSNQLRPTELYEGSKNTFMMDVLHRYTFFKRKLLDFMSSAEFSCSFDMISLYPFGHQNCSFTFFCEQSGNLTPGGVTYLGSSQTGQYQIDKWYLTCSTITRGEDCNNCEVSINFLLFLSLWYVSRTFLCAV